MVATIVIGIVKSVSYQCKFRIFFWLNAEKKYKHTHGADVDFYLHVLKVLVCGGGYKRDRTNYLHN